MKNIFTTYLIALFIIFNIQLFASSKKAEKVIIVSSINQIEINAYPNPFSEGINLEITTNNSHPTTLKVFDIIGIERQRIELAQFGSSNIYKILLKDLPSGVYFCNVYAENKLLESKKIVSL